MTPQREMTLQEWIEKLPEIHAARIEFSQLQTKVAELDSGRQKLVLCNLTAEEQITEMRAKLTEYRRMLGLAKAAMLNALTSDAASYRAFWEGVALIEEPLKEEV